MNTQPNLLKRSRQAGITVIALASLGMLVACGSQNATTSAASQSPSASSSRQAGNLGSRVCFTNLTGSDVPIEITDADTGEGLHQVPDKGQFCAEGTNSIAPVDVAGRVDVGHVIDADNVHKTKYLSFPFRVNNPWIGKPVFFVRGYCTGEASWHLDVNETKYADSSSITMEITRKPDGQWKNFDVLLTKSKGCSEYSKK